MPKSGVKKLPSGKWSAFYKGCIGKNFETYEDAVAARILAEANDRKRKRAPSPEPTPVPALPALAPPPPSAFQPYQRLQPCAGFPISWERYGYYANLYAHHMQAATQAKAAMDSQIDFLNAIQQGELLARMQSQMIDQARSN